MLLVLLFSLRASTLFSRLHIDFLLSSLESPNCYQIDATANPDKSAFAKKFRNI